MKIKFMNLDTPKLFINILLLFLSGQNLYSQNLTKTDSLIVTISKMPDDTNKVNRLNDLVWEIKISDFKKADSLGNIGYNLSKKINYEKGIAYATKNLGGAYYCQSDYDKALHFYKKSFNSFQKIKDKKGIATAYRNLANIYHLKGNWKQALDYYFKSLAVIEEIGDKKGIADVYCAIGLLYDVSGQEEKIVALKYYKQALDIQKELGDEFGIATSYLQMGAIYFNKYEETKNNKIADTAIFYLLKSREISEKIKALSNIAIIDEGIGRIYLIQNKFDKSYKYLTNSLTLNTELGYKWGVAASTESLGSYYLELKKYKKAETYFLKANRLSIEIGAKVLERYYSFFLAKTYYHQNKFKKSAQYYQRHIILKDSLMNEEKTKEMTRLAMQYEFDKKQKLQEAEKQKREALQEAKIKRQKTITYFLIAGFLLIIILAILTFRTYRNKIKANEQILRFKEVFNAIEEERKRITIDLHDSVGQMLSTTKLYLSRLKETIEKQSEDDKMIYSETIKLIDESSSELRNILYNIMPDSLVKFGLKTTIEEISNKISAGSNITFNLKSKGFEKRQSETLEIILYRIIQEALNNIIKHAWATEIDINMIKKSKKIYLSIYDNGKGMDDFELYKNKGLGWKSIFSRVQMLNGKVKVETGIDKGTKINIIIPL